MPFPFIIFLFFLTYTNLTMSNRIYHDGRAAEFDFSRKTVFSWKAEKASDSASERITVKASITVEAIVCIPLFFYAALCLIWMLEIRTVQTVIRSGMQETGKRIAESACQYDLLSPTQMENMLVEVIGAERLDRSIVVQGARGLDCNKSYEIPGVGIYELCVNYRTKLPFPFFRTGITSYTEKMRIKGWNGYVKEPFGDMGHEQMVYITETGLVYHLDYHCTYLEPSIKTVSEDGLAGLRNRDGEKYSRCPLCAGIFSRQGQIYITSYGNRYHYSASCSGLKRTIYTVPVSEVKGRSACSKCGK